MKYTDIVKNVLNGKIENRIKNRARAQAETFENNLQKLSDYVSSQYGAILQAVTIDGKGEKIDIKKLKEQCSKKLFRIQHISRALLFVPCSDEMRKQAGMPNRQISGDYVKGCLSLGVNHTTSVGCHLGFCIIGNCEQGHALIAKGLTVKQANSLKGKNAKETVLAVQKMKAETVTPCVETDKTEKVTAKKVTAKKVTAKKVTAKDVTEKTA
jgi:hypothetical protein